LRAKAMKLLDIRSRTRCASALVPARDPSRAAVSNASLPVS
jgi:hypothetical protein